MAPLMLSHESHVAVSESHMAACEGHAAAWHDLKHGLVPIGTVVIKGELRAHSAGSQISVECT